MKDSTKQAYIDALTNAATMIEGHVGVGLTEDDIGDYSIDTYLKQCKKVAKLLENIAAKKRKLVLKITPIS